MPASRNARAMIFAPRSCPSRPGFAITTRIFFATPSSLRPLLESGVDSYELQLPFDALDQAPLLRRAVDLAPIPRCAPIDACQLSLFQRFPGQLHEVQRWAEGPPHDVCRLERTIRSRKSNVRGALECDDTRPRARGVYGRPVKRAPGLRTVGDLAGAGPAALLVRRVGARENHLPQDPAHVYRQYTATCQSHGDGRPRAEDRGAGPFRGFRAPTVPGDHRSGGDRPLLMGGPDNREPKQSRRGCGRGMRRRAACHTEQAEKTESLPQTRQRPRVAHFGPFT